MPGCVIDGTPIAVDFWRLSKAPQARLFFLTHLHSDHTEGLTTAWKFPIYTSTTTALLLKNKYKLPDSIIWELEVGQSYLIPLDEDNTTITVTLIDANHVPGSVMFLFQGYFGNILYCGDMRWRREMLEDPVLKSVVDQRELDIVYLDNTYSAPYCQFPSREEVKKQIFDIIDAYPDHEIKIGINSLGGERLLEDIAQRYGEKILVSEEKFQQIKILGCLDVFTTDPAQSRIHAFPKNEVQVAAHVKWNAKHPTISIIPTALFVGWKNSPYSAQAKHGMFVVPYSDHSSYSELKDMISLLAPHQIYPIIKYLSLSGWWLDPSAPDQKMKGDMTVYRDLLSPPPPSPIFIPKGVLKLMRSDAPKLFRIQPRKCVIRKGLLPRSSKIRSVTRSSVGMSSPHSSSYSSPSTPTFTNIESSTNISKHSKSKQLEKVSHSAKRKLVLPSEDENVETKDEEVSLVKKIKLEKSISEKTEALMKVTANFIARKTELLWTKTTSRSTDDEVRVMIDDSKVILESLKCFDFFI